MSVCVHRPEPGGIWVECAKVGGCRCAAEVRANVPMPVPVPVTPPEEDR